MKTIKSARWSARLVWEDRAPVALANLVPIFHDWIQQQRLPGELLVDIADYSHVPGGPGVLLMGHGLYYAVDSRREGGGLRYRRSRFEEALPAERLRRLLEGLFAAARLLEQAPSLGGGSLFRTDLLEICVEDRLAAPNDDGSLELLRPALDEALSGLCPGASPALKRISVGDEAFRVEVALGSSRPLEQLLQRPQPRKAA